MTERATPRRPSFPENLLFGTTISEVPTFLPGVLLAAIVVVVSVTLVELIDTALGFDGLVSFILVAIVLGMVVRNTVGLDERFAPGVQFALRKLLRLGIILLGIRLSILDVLEIGGYGIPIVVGAVLTGLVVASAAARRLGLSDRLGALIAIGTGICGTTAIVAAAPGLNAREEEVTYAIANITIFGIAAMVFYPFLGNLVFSGDIIKTGLFLGTSIHETAQVAGAGLIYDQSFNIRAAPSVADIAVVGKLVRNVTMVIVIPLVTYLYAKNRRRADEDARKGTRVLDMIPVFILGFLVMAGVRTFGDAGVDSGGLAFGLWGEERWVDLTHGIRAWAEYTLGAAMAAVGLGTSLKQVRGLGFKPFVIGIAAALSVGVVSVGLVSLFGPLISV
jgi:uncharacterized integral membrane protein (TIGR00698 family)